jgi:hypothetical protein
VFQQVSNRHTKLCLAFTIFKHGREAEALSRLRALTQRNTELACETQQAQKAAAAMDLKLERLQKQLAAARKATAAHDSSSATQLEQLGTQVGNNTGNMPRFLKIRHR